MNEHPKGKDVMLKLIILVLCIVIPNTIYALPLHSKNALVYNETQDKIILKKNIHQQVSIASLTKLMTAIVTLESNQNLGTKIKLTDKDIDKLKHTTSRLPIGTTLTKDQALLLMLMSSENRAASALLRNYPGGRREGLKDIHKKIKQLELESTKIVDSNGLNPKNVSSSIDLLKIVKYASKFDKITQFSTRKSYTFSKKHYINSNPIVRERSFSNISLSKTGFINEAGMCLVMRFTVNKQTYILILLNSASKHQRVADAKSIYRWIQKSNQHVLTKVRNP